MPLNFPNYGKKVPATRPGAAGRASRIRRSTPIKVKLPGKGSKRGQNKG